MFIDLHALSTSQIGCLKGGETNNRVDPKVCKKCCYKTTWAVKFVDPNSLTGSLGCACVYTVPRRLDYCTQEAVLS